MKKWLLFVFITFVTLPSPLWAEQVPYMYKLSMREAILLALRFNPNVQSAEVQRVVDKFNLLVARYQFEFQYGLTGNAQYSSVTRTGAETRISRLNLIPNAQRETPYGTKFKLTMDNPVSGGSEMAHYYNPLLSFRVTQPIMKGSGREVVEAALNTAINSEEIAKLNLKNTVMGIITQIILDYNGVISAENTLFIDKNALALAERVVEQNKARIAAGFMAPSENVQAEANVAVQKLQVESDINSVIQAKLALTNDIGLYPTTNIKIDSTVSLKNTDYPKGEYAKNLLLSNNVPYQIELITLKNSKLNVIQAVDRQRWTLDFDATFTQGGGTGGGKNAGLPSLTNQFNQSRVYDLALSIPIDNKPLQQVLVSARVSLKQQELSVRLLKLQLERDLEGTLQNLAILRQQIELSKQSRALARQSYDDSLQQLEYGQVSVFEVSVLQTNYTTAELAVLTNEILYLNAVAQYRQSLGTTLDVWKIGIRY
ncbi:MAG: hypothetical protein A3E84_00400 [Gammaproteobacteria bacterium RIFCSPHIGHO2_12_FULL_42_13]|nr:MAG: hypothetical protein A3E84_00400 [Gammaproteobacteria bacterium RIFCSPHIGHO2_12_FULL_42_13]